MSPRLSLDAALALDAADPHVSRREEFHFPRAAGGEPAIYLCGNSLGLQPRRAADEVAKFMAEWQRLGVLGYHDPDADWLNLHERLAPTLAALVGAKQPEVVAMNSLTINLHLLMASFYRPTRERHVILIEQGAFPSDRYAVASQLGWHGRDRAASFIQANSCCGTRTSSPRSTARVHASRSCCCLASSTSRASCSTCEDSWKRRIAWAPSPALILPMPPATCRCPCTTGASTSRSGAPTST
jgi:kynureninase